jgi:uncharacterized protein
VEHPEHNKDIDSQFAFLRNSRRVIIFDPYLRQPSFGYAFYMKPTCASAASRFPKSARAAIFAFLIVAMGCNGMQFIYSTSRDHRGRPSDLGITYEEIWFASRDGLQLNAWLVPGAADKPLILFCQGNAANITYRLENIQVFNRLGFSVFIFDYRGFGLSQGKPQTENDLYQDVRGAIDFLQTRGWSPAQMIFYGQSMGAAIALQAGLEDPPAAIVLECPFTSMSEIAWHLRPITYLLVGWWGIGARFDNLGKIDQLKVPVMILQGDQDVITPPQMAIRLFERASSPKTFHLFPGGNHSDLYKVGGQSYEAAWMQFVQHADTSVQ